MKTLGPEMKRSRSVKFEKIELKILRTFEILQITSFMILRIFPNLLVAPFKDGTDFPFDICVLTKKIRNQFLASGNLLFVWSFSQKAPWKLRFADQILKKRQKRTHVGTEE